MTDQMRLEEEEEEGELSKWLCDGNAVCCHSTWIEKQIQSGLQCSVQPEAS